MTGVFSWKSILEYVSSYNPLDSGVDSASVGFASIGFALSALLSGYSTAKYGYLGYLVLFIQKQGMLGLRTSVIIANFQKGLGAPLRVFLVYMAKFRMGLVRMTLYTYATFISGSQLLWVSPSKRSYRRVFLAAQLSMLGAGYAGEGSTSYFFNTQLKQAEEKSRKNRVNNGSPTTADGTDPLLIEICVRGTHKKTIREARGVLRTCCYQELSWTEKENSGNGLQGTARQLERENARKMRNRIRKKLFAAKLPGTILGTVLAAVYSTDIFIKISTAVTVISYNLFFWMGAQYYDLGEMENYDKKDEEKIDAKDKKQILDAVSELTKAVEAAVETAVNAVHAVLERLLSLPIIIIPWPVKSSEPKVAKSTWGENKSGEKDKQDEKDEEEIDGKDGKQNPGALKKAVEEAVEAVIKLLPLWLTFASTCYLVNATGDSFFMEQVDYLEKNTQSVKIPESVFYFLPDIVSIITWLVSYYLVERFYDEKKEKRWARLLRISIGMLFSSLCCIVASLVAYRLDSNYNSASMLWLLPQFLLWGMMKGILEEGLEDFLDDNLDNLHDNELQLQLKVLAVCGIAEAVGYFLSMILTAVSPSSWVGSGSDISESNLGNYYRMLAIITLFSTFVFTIVAIAYELREKEGTEKNGKKY